MTDQIKLDLPKFTIEPTAPIYDFGFIASALGLIPLPEGIAIRPEAIVMIEDDALPEDEDGEIEPEPTTLIHLSNQHSIALNPDQMSALETFIKNAQKMMADAQRERALTQARNQGGNAQAAREIALKAGLIKPGR